MNFIEQHKINNTVTLDISHLKQSIAKKLISCQLSPIHISLGDMIVNVRSEVNKATLVYYQAYLVFQYNNRNYLLIYNK